MADKKTKKLTVPQGGVLRNFVRQLKLILRLLGDRRVSFWTKLIPFGALIYLVSPVDFIMGIPGQTREEILANSGYENRFTCY